MGITEELQDNISQWIISPRRVATDFFFTFAAFTLFYNGWVEVHCESGQSGYLYCESVRLLYFSAGIVCILFVTTAFKEGRLKTTAGRFLSAETVRQPSSIKDLDIDPSNFAIRETADELKLEPAENEPKEFTPERDE